ncbi:MAG: hypothetical protein MUF15_20695 [Acidobacteria bacterium]|jgi:hypothetical protein|nr:hypothetical protein [Acidobacteriota bacterium]
MKNAGKKVFYGIYHEEGKGIHLNDIYLNFKDIISVETDKQVYAPGEVPGGATKILSYWLKCPDQTGAYEIKTEIYEGRTKIEEVVLDIEVSETVHSRLIDIINELEALDIKGPDTSYIRQAKHFLETILNRSTGSLIDQLFNLHDSVQATEAIGKSEDVSLLRLKIGDIMISMGRKFYETVKQSGLPSLLPLTGLIAAD